MVRSRAVSGLGDIAFRGDAAALAALRELLSHPDPVLREVAARAYLRSGDRAQRSAELAAVLPPGDRYVLGLREALHPQEVAQPRRPSGLGRRQRPAADLPMPGARHGLN